MSEEFDVADFMSTLNVLTDDEDVANVKLVVENVELLYDDPWMCRAAFWGLTSAAHNQLTYIGSNMLPNLERRLNVLEGTGVLSESDVGNNWFSNEDKPHVNDDVSKEDQIDDIKVRIDNLTTRLRVAAISFVGFMRIHDEISVDLGQMSFAEIRRSAEAKRNPTRTRQQVA